jgi:hypothetical protein
MMKNTPKYSKQVLIAAVKNCAARAQDSYNALGSAAACDNDYEVWERFLDNACNWAAQSNDCAIELAAVVEHTRTYGAN